MKKPLKGRPAPSGSEDYGIDGHKLLYHVGHVRDWLDGKAIDPIFMEVSPADGCNHRCIFCGLDYVNRRRSFLDLPGWRRLLRDTKGKGLKSILFSGEGEPLLHPDIIRLVRETRKAGIEVAVGTNLSVLTEGMARKILPNLTWIRTSLDAGTSATYAKIHGVRAEQFDKVLKNIAMAVRIKRQEKLAVTIGVQFLLLKENVKEVETAIKLVRRLGADYLSVKPYSKHPLSHNEAGSEVDYRELLKLEPRLKRYSTKSFRVIFRAAAMRRKLVVKPYTQCLGLPFWSFVSANGDIYPCSTFLGLKKYRLGNIQKESFRTIWKSARRKRIMRGLSKMDARTCRELCRLDAINAYLWKLKHPPAHVNFI